MGLTERWKAAKRSFDVATKKKNPANVFLKTRVPGGIESAAKAYDAAQTKANVKAMQKAHATLMKKARAYFRALEQASTKEKGVNYKPELKKLGDALDGMAKSIERDLEEADRNARTPQRLRLSLELKKVKGFVDLQSQSQEKMLTQLRELAKQSKADANTIIKGVKLAQGGDVPALKDATEANRRLLKAKDDAIRLSKSIQLKAKKSEGRLRSAASVADFELMCKEDSQLAKAFKALVRVVLAMGKRTKGLNRSVDPVLWAYEIGKKTLGGSEKQLELSGAGKGISARSKKK